jgi:hypothetical protein
MEGHVKAIAVLWIIWGVLGIFFALFLFLLLIGISFIPDMGYEAPIILRTVGTGVGLLIAVLSLPEVIAGIGLLKFKEWGRILTLVVAFFGLLEFPLGTALGVYSIIILLKAETLELIKSKA